MPFNGNGLTLGLVDSIDFIKDINPKLVLPIHLIETQDSKLQMRNYI